MTGEGTCQKIVVIAAEHAQPPAPGAAIIRFAGIPQPDENAVEGLVAARDNAQRSIKETFGAWLYNWMLEAGVLNLARWDFGISWWWFAPLSERSPLRGDIIIRIHQLMVLDQILRTHRPVELHWIDSLPLMREPVATIAARHGAKLKFETCGRPPWRRRLAMAILFRGYTFVADSMRFILLRIFAAPFSTGTQMVFMTRFPVLWERHANNWQERMYGRLPQFLSGPPAYAASLNGTVWQWLRRIREWRRVMADNAIIPVISAGTIGDVFCAHFPLPFWRSYIRWRGRPNIAIFNGIDITALLRRELDFTVIDPDIANTRLIARNLPRLVRRLGARLVFYPFEYQPIEKAATAAAHAAGAKAIGLQTGVFTSGQLGFLPNAAEIGDRSDGMASSLPDMLFTYGKIVSALFRPVMPQDTVHEMGALRYGQLAELVLIANPVTESREQAEVLVVCSSVPEETWPIIHAALDLAARHPEIYLTFKFHYHLSVEKQIAKLAQERIPGRWRTEAHDLYALINAAQMVIVGSSSVAYESLALGRPTVIYLPPAGWLCSPAAETPDAFIFFHTAEELLEAYEDIVQGRRSVTQTSVRAALDAQLQLNPHGEAALISLLDLAGRKK